MKFRTEVCIPNSQQKIEINDAVFSIGSCFATEIASKLSDGQLQILNNPFGTIFNPYSLYEAIKNIHTLTNYTEKNLILHNDQYISLDHHSSFNSGSMQQTLDNINGNIQLAHAFIKKTNWVIITYGSSIVYEFLPSQRIVSNCHKIPQKYFAKRFLQHTELIELYGKTINLLRETCSKDIQILFTISPVRHSKSDMVENQLSKSKLIASLHEVIAQHENCHYLPIYEMLMDDLRDYRFYKDDLVHPNNQAIQYIWEKFGEAYFSEQTQGFITENHKIKQALEHRVFDSTNPQYQEFIKNLRLKIAQQQQKVNHKIFQ